jgi:hypothetical protein
VEISVGDVVITEDGVRWRIYSINREGLPTWFCRSQSLNPNGAQRRPLATDVVRRRLRMALHSTRWDRGVTPRPPSNEAWVVRLGISIFLQ